MASPLKGLPQILSCTNQTYSSSNVRKIANVIRTLSAPTIRWEFWGRRGRAKFVSARARNDNHHTSHSQRNQDCGYGLGRESANDFSPVPESTSRGSD